MIDQTAGPLVSILITTFNRSFFLARCLTSIEEFFSDRGYANDIEVVVLNNGCTDDTAEALRSFESRLPLRIFHERENIGFIPALRKCVSLSAGRYCWFLGDDDYIAHEISALKSFLLSNNPDIVMLNHFFYIYEDGRVIPIKKAKDFLMKDSRPLYFDFSQYMMSARHPNAFFCHIAPVIFRRQLWDAHLSEGAFQRHYDSHSLHMYVFLSILKDAERVGYLAEQFLALRVGAPYEEWLQEEGRYTRFLMDVEYFTNMVRDVTDEAPIIRHFKDVMLKKSVIVLLLGTKLRCNFTFGFYRRLLGLLYRNYRGHPFFWWGIIPLFLTPRTVIRVPYRLLLK